MRSVQLVADTQIAVLEDIAANGLNPVYDSLHDFLWDFYPDFDWGGIGNLYQLVAFYRHPKYEAVRQALLARFGEDVAPHRIDFSRSILAQLEEDGIGK